MVKRRLLYLLIFLLPLQLARHFFSDFSKIAGIHVDYLVPTIYLTDLIVLTLIFLDIREGKPFSVQGKRKFGKPLWIFLGFTFISSIFIADNTGAAVYKLLKLAEFIWLFSILSEIRPNIRSIVTSYSLAIIYSAILAIYQFLLQHSAGGWWWYLGERSFYETTPGIALGSIWGKLYLRPYATFPHPNVLGGFLALGLPLVFFQFWKDRRSDFIRTIIYSLALILGSIALILTFSRAAILIFIILLILICFSENKKIRNYLAGIKRAYLGIFILLFILSVILPLRLSKSIKFNKGSLFERSQLTATALANIFKFPVVGTGLNNSIIYQYQKMPKNFGLFVMQPVHNVYLLILTELGSIGFIFLLYFLNNIFQKINRRNIVRFLPFFMLLVLGFFDHYLFTLQQGGLIFILFTSLVFWPWKA